jgi:CubicO group peptidase (beta-lactamase class C family)
VRRLVFCFLLLVALRIPARSLDVQNFERAATYSALHEGKSLLVQQHGKTIFEKFANGGSAHEPLKIYSGTKGFWILAALAAQEDGILNLDERVADTLKEWRSDPRKARLTIRDLLTFTAGLDPVFHLHSDDYPDRNAVALISPAVAERGATFIYGPAALQDFDELFRRKLGARHDSPQRYLERKVLAPMGLGPQNYKPDRAGNPLLASGFRLTAEQWARLGEVILHNGAPIVAARAFSDCCHGTEANPEFGMGFWNNHEAGPGAREFDIEDMLELDWRRQDWRDACICRNAPADLIAAVGSGYQRLFVVPSLDLVVVRQGTGGRFSDAQFLRLLLGR